MALLFRITTVPISLKTLLKGQHSFMVKNGFDVCGISSNGPELSDVEYEEGIKTVSLDMTRRISPLKDLISLWKFYKLCKNDKPVIVHSHTPKAGIVGMLGAKLAGVPIRLHTVAGLPLMETTGFKRILLDYVEKLTYSCASMVYPNSKGLYDFILENKYTSTKKLKVIANGSSNGINTSFFSREKMDVEKLVDLKIKLGIKDNDFVFIFVGRLVGDKGINELIHAFKLLSAKSKYSSKLKLMLVGALEADLDPLNTETLIEMQNNKNILTVGFQNDVRPYFAISDALVFPSYREGFPNVVMQAGAMDLPAIVSNINGCNEIIVEGRNGMIIPVKNTEALIRAMSSMLEDESYFYSLRLNARKMISEKYEQQVIWDALLEEYNYLLKSRSKITLTN